jgi:hypothetical protein
MSYQPGPPARLLLFGCAGTFGRAGVLRGTGIFCRAGVLRGTRVLRSAGIFGCTRVLRGAGIHCRRSTFCCTGGGRQGRPCQGQAQSARAKQCRQGATSGGVRLRFQIARHYISSSSCDVPGILGQFTAHYSFSEHISVRLQFHDANSAHLSPMQGRLLCYTSRPFCF